jgi:uncharacterized protein
MKCAKVMERIARRERSEAARPNTSFFILYFSFFICKTMDTRFGQISTLIVKVTHRCNLDCLYCYENITKTGEDMQIETFRDLVELTLSQTAQHEVTFLFHGGEPTLLPNAWYDEAVSYARERAKFYGKRVCFSMQTNLLGINPAKIDLFKRHGIQLGISLDGPASLQSTQRGGEDKVFKHFKQIQAAGVRAGVLVTINESNYPYFFAICDWLVREAGVKSFKANVVTPVGRGVDMAALSADKIFEAQHAILQYMMQTGGKTLIEDNISGELRRFFASPEARRAQGKSLCHDKRCGAGELVLGVTPNGDLLPCGRFTWDESGYYLGNLRDDIAVSPDLQADFGQKLNDFHALVPQSWYDCDSCAARDVCGFGCQAFIVRSRAQANVDCLPTKMRYKFYQENAEALREVYTATLPPPRAATPFRVKQKDGTYKVYQLG